ncbi:MAG: hypothetical protein JSS64_02570, partial [Bacteroidetes bacterium]|nr:hypothetical protein [Bacteroidota bacterium]
MQYSPEEVLSLMMGVAHREQKNSEGRYRLANRDYALSGLCSTAPKGCYPLIMGVAHLEQKNSEGRYRLANRDYALSGLCSTAP